MNEGLTRPKGPGHPVVGLRVNCPPLGPTGQQSSSGGSTVSGVQLYDVQRIRSCAAYALYTIQFMEFVVKILTKQFDQRSCYVKPGYHLQGHFHNLPPKKPASFIYQDSSLLSLEKSAKQKK